MKILCLGNNTELTDQQATELAKRHDMTNKGLLSDLEGELDLDNLQIDPGVHHTSVLDMSISRIQRISKLFNKTVVLDQPVKIWNHPDEFYLTQHLACNLPNAEWQNIAGKQQVEYWTCLVNENKSFCIFPFIELLTNNNHTTVCCRSATPIVNINELSDFSTDENYKKIRSRMLAGETLSEHCSSCYQLESRGIRSARQQETIEWAVRLNLQSTKDLDKITKPVYYEVRPSNVCNIMCRICNPQSSNKIEKEWQSLGWLNPDKQIEYSDFNIVDTSGMKKLYVAGGEPTAMPEFYNFLEKCIDEKNTNFEFIINTNAVKISNKLLNLTRQFSNLQFMISVDGYNKSNDYSRWGSDWSTVLDNITKLKNNGHKIMFNITLSLYTVLDFAKLVKFLDTCFTGCLVHGQIADNIYPFVFEFSDKQIQQLETITNTNIYKNDSLFCNFVDGIVELAKSSKLDKEKLQHFFNFNDTLDISRNSCLNDYIPEIEKLRKLL